MALAHLLYSASIGWNSPITDHHGFRQTQTAISTYYILREPPSLWYSTPVLGMPWAIPMEFPLYQWLVALTARATAMGLDQAGRLISVTSYVLILVPLWTILRRLRVAMASRLLFLALCLVSPFYSFWARTFMIETLALLLSLSYAAAAIPAIRDRRFGALLLAIGFGLLAGVTKVTTFAAFSLVPGILVLPECLALLKRKAPLRTFASPVLRAAAVSVIPVAGAATWAARSDAVKMLNPIGRFLTSSALGRWNFGDASQRISGDAWAAILSRAPTLLCHPAVFWPLLVGLGAALVAFRRRWKESLVCAALFLVSPLIFTNLHVVHDYYMCANGIFLLAAIGFAIAGIAESMKSPYPVMALGAALCVAATVMHSSDYLPVQRTGGAAFLEFAASIRARTSPDEVNIYLGWDWDSSLPYYTERRALMIPDWSHLPEEAVREALGNLRGQRIGCVVIRPGSRYPAARLLELLGPFRIPPDRIVKSDGS